MLYVQFKLVCSSAVFFGDLKKKKITFPLVMRKILNIIYEDLKSQRIYISDKIEKA